MICPACSHPMIVVEHKHIELDYCAACQGVWFDNGELELFLDSFPDQTGKKHLDFFNLPEATTSEKKRRCPICSSKMQKGSLGTDPAIIVDVCQKNHHGLFFDGGEVNQLVKTMSSGRGVPIIDFLAETLKSTN